MTFLFFGVRRVKSGFPNGRATMSSSAGIGTPAGGTDVVAAAGAPGGGLPAGVIGGFGKFAVVSVMFLSFLRNHRQSLFPLCVLLRRDAHAFGDFQFDGSQCLNTSLNWLT